MLSRGHIDFIKNRLEVVHGSKDVIIYVGRNNVSNKDKMFERSEILFRKHKKLN